MRGKLYGCGADAAKGFEMGADAVYDVNETKTDEGIDSCTG